MSLTVETGAGLATANSYASLAEATAYHLDRGNAAWAAATSDAVREAALVKATAYLDGRYGGRYPGRRLVEAQALLWPRAEAWDADGFPLVGIPAALKAATAEAALRALSGDLAPDSEGLAGVRRRRVGNVEIEYQGAALPATFPAVEWALERIIRGSHTVRISR